MQKMKHILFATALAAITLGGDANLHGVLARQHCAKDLQALATRRETALKAVNEVVQAYEGQPLPPSVFCPKFADVRAAETPLLDYMTKNRNRCKIPQTAIDQLMASMDRTRLFGLKYCS